MKVGVCDCSGSGSATAPRGHSIAQNIGSTSANHHGCGSADKTNATADSRPRLIQGHPVRPQRGLTGR
jgi:hypothetical protein